MMDQQQMRRVRGLVNWVVGAGICLMLLSDFGEPASAALTTASLEQMVRLAVSSSQQAQNIRLQKRLAQGSFLRARQPLDSLVFHSISVRESSPQGWPQSSVESVQSGSLRSGFTTQFLTGTHLEASVGASMQERELTEAKGKEVSYSADFKVEVRQDLLRNRWGRLRRLELEAADEELKAVEQEISSELMELAMRVSQRFFALKISQERYRSVVKRREKNSEILDAARLLHKRGSLETADLYQIETRSLRSQQSEREALVSLKNSWDQITSEFGLEKMMSIQVTEIDLSYDKPKSSAQNCEQQLPWQKMPSYLGLQRRYRSSLRRQEQAQEQQRSQLDAELSYQLRGSEGELPAALGDTLGSRGQWSAVLSYRRSLGGSGAQAALWQSSAAASRAKLALDSFQSRRSSQIRQTCLRLQWLEDKKELLSSIYARQSSRARLEGKRYEIGRQDFFSATESELAQIIAQHDLDAVRLEVAEQHWQLALLKEELTLQGLLN